MQFSIVLSGLVAFLASSATAAKLDMRLTAPKALMEKRGVLQQCTSANDCCLSTYDACKRQASGWQEGFVECPLVTLCPELGVPIADCDADCCSISRKKGRGCPGK